MDKVHNKAIILKTIQGKAETISATHNSSSRFVHATINFLFISFIHHSTNPVTW
jgi:hypothetical protein